MLPRKQASLKKSSACNNKEKDDFGLEGLQLSMFAEFWPQFARMIRECLHNFGCSLHV